MTSYPAITVWQPWATLISADGKPLEFRSWPAPARLIGRRIAIHAGARKVRRRELNDLICQIATTPKLTGLNTDIASPLLDAAWSDLSILPLSAIVCLATLGKPIRDADLAEQLGVPHLNDSDRDEHSNWGWPLTDIQPLEPVVPAKGHQGWWTWSTDA